MRHVPDPRSRRGRPSPLPPVRALLVLGRPPGRRPVPALRGLVAVYGAELALLLGLPRARVPTASNPCKLLPRLDTAALEAVLSAWGADGLAPLPAEATPAARGPAAEPPLVNRDGKVRRGSARRGAGPPGVHLVSAFAPHVPAVLAQSRAQSKTNEHKAALEPRRTRPPRPGGYGPTGDAIFCQTEVCQAIHDRGGRYGLAVKDNRPGRAVDSAAGLTFARPAAPFPPAGRCPAPAGPAPGPTYAATTDTRHGRVEHRSLESTPVLAQTHRWPGLRPGFGVRRYGPRAGRPDAEEVYGLTRLGPAEADAAALLAIARAGRGADDRLHYRRDVPLGEDACQGRGGAAPQVPAASRNATVYGLTAGPADSHAAATRRRAARPHEALHLLDPPT